MALSKFFIFWLDEGNSPPKVSSQHFLRTIITVEILLCCLLALYAFLDFVVFVLLEMWLSLID